MEKFRPVLVTAPAALAVTLAEFKARATIEHDDDDDWLTDIVNAAISHFDGWTGVLGRCLVDQTWRQDFHEWGASLRLPFPDCSSVVVKYSDVNNAEQTVSSSLYHVQDDDLGTVVTFLDDFTDPTLYDDRPEAVRVTFVSGYGASAANVPPPIRTAIVMHGRDLFEMQAGRNMPAIDALIAPYRRQRF